MQRLKLRDIELAIIDRGRGPAVLLIHGFPLDHSMWNAQLEALAARHRVIAPDLRGFGASGVTPGTVTMRDQAADLAALLDELEIAGPVTICGLSMGGYIAFQFHHDFPRRVAALILCDTRAGADTPAGAAARRETADRVLREGSAFLADSMIPKLFSPTTLRQQPQLADAVRHTILANPAAGIAAAARGMAERLDASTWLPTIACPTLVVVGRDDPLSPPAEMAALAAAIGRAQLVEVADAGHLSPLEQPAAVNRAMSEFLAGLA